MELNFGENVKMKLFMTVNVWAVIPESDHLIVSILVVWFCAFIWENDNLQNKNHKIISKMRFHNNE